MSLVAIVGRPNVGKSTLFNRLVGMRQAIVDETAGVTRDRHYGKCEWCGREFSVVDTGGYTSNSDDIFEEEIRKQVALATDEADVILFLVDAHNGVTDLDEAVANILAVEVVYTTVGLDAVDYQVFDTCGSAVDNSLESVRRNIVGNQEESPESLHLSFRLSLEELIAFTKECVITS